MSAFENVVLLCGIQTFVMSVILLIGIVLQQSVFGRRSTTLVSAGLASMILLWAVACLPINGWVTTQTLLDSSDHLASSMATHQEQSSAAKITNETRVNNAGISEGHTLADEQSNFAQFAAVALQQMETLTVSAAASEARGWKSWLAGCGLIAIGIGMLRLIVSHFTVWRLCTGSRSLADDDAHELLDTVLARLHCNRTVRLYETAETPAAFTVGWLKPKICLSEGWRAWQRKELEATLAHEVAHINSRDFLQRVIAQFSAALNYYNPIVHYLCNKLCIEQEYKADARAAEVVGGQTDYLNTLASLALRHEYSNQRLALMFLPTRKSFFRRIEMLRLNQNNRVESPLAKAVTLVFVSLIVVSVAGFRFAESPAVDSTVLTQTNQETTADLRFVAADADAVLVMRPARLLKKDLVRKAYDAFKNENEQKNQLDEMLDDLFAIRAEEIDQLTCVFTDVSLRTNPVLVWIVQTGGNAWWAGADIDEQMASNLFATSAASFRGRAIYVSEKPMMPAAYYVADDRTLVCTIGGRHESDMSLRAIKAAIRAAKGPSGDWSAAWQGAADRDVSCVVLNGALEAIQAQMTQHPKDPVSPMLQPILESADFVVASANHSDRRTDMEATLQCGSDSDMESVKEAVIGIKALAKTWLKNAKRDMFSQKNRRPGNQGTEIVLDLPLALLQDLEINSDSKRIVLKTQLIEQQQDLLQPLIPAIVSARRAALRIESMNHLRQLTLAFHNYHDVYGHFPPPVLTSKEGKKYSWRIAILPFLECQHIYDQYRFDQDWNSEDNLKVTSQAPATFQHPLARNNGSTSSSYYVVVGEQTPFFGDEGTRLTEIIDGTSNTICIVEAKKDVHWAEPRDIVFDGEQLDTRLGGYHEDGFNVSFCDGSARFISSDVDKEVLKFLITSRDGHVIDHQRLR